MLKMYDCSNSKARPTHREGGGPVQNDVMRQLREHSNKYNCKYVDEPGNADIIITNDVYPPDILTLNKKLIKRMDGVFWLKSLRLRNEPLNLAAQQSDHVIFISKYSEESYFNIYGKPLKKSSVILNSADTRVFKPDRTVSKELKIAVASATDWARPEKRLCLYVELAKAYPNLKILMIGKLDFDVPDNIIKCGYQDSEAEMAKIMNKADCMISFSYRDPCPKTIWQGRACGLPILYTTSGGQPEQVIHGSSIPDNESTGGEQSDSSMVELTSINKGYLNLKHNYYDLTESAMRSAKQDDPFQDMMSKYFNIINKTHEGR